MNPCLSVVATQRSDTGARHEPHCLDQEGRVGREEPEPLLFRVVGLTILENGRCPRPLPLDTAVADPRALGSGSVDSAGASACSVARLNAPLVAAEPGWVARGTPTGFAAFVPFVVHPPDLRASVDFRISSISFEIMPATCLQ